MATYYCDLGGTYGNKSGADHTGNQLLGPGGFQAAFTGQGNATALAAGDILQVKGTANLTRLVELTCGKDVSGWSLADTVVDNDTGAKWSGKVCELSIGANTAIIRVELAIGGDEDTIITADGINNTSAVDTTTLSAKDCRGIRLEAASGTTTSAIKLLGVNSSWAVASGGAGNSTAYQAVLDGNGDADYCFTLTGACNYWHVENFTFKSALIHNIDSHGESAAYWNWRHCLTHSGGSHGMYWYKGSRIKADFCIFRDNTRDGFNTGYYNGNFFNLCVIEGNSESGLSCAYMDCLVIAKCLLYENTGNNIQPSTSSYVAVLDCVSDGAGGSGMLISASRYGYNIRGCRFTNNGAYGVNQATSNYMMNDEDYCVFHGNTTAARVNMDAGAHSDDNPTDDGYVDAAADDYNIDTGSEIRSTAVVLEWG